MDVTQAFALIRPKAESSGAPLTEEEDRILSGLLDRLRPHVRPQVGDADGQELVLANIPKNKRDRHGKLGPGDDIRTMKRHTGGRSYKFVAVLQALFLSKLVRNALNLPEVLYRSVHYCLGSSLAQDVKKQLEAGRLQCEACKFWKG